MECIQRSRCSRRGELLGAALALLPACSGSLPRPPTGPVPSDAMIEVPYPPPPARVEVIPPQTDQGDVWVDGQWDWDGRAWKWLAGAWVTPPPGAYFTPWALGRRRDGRLFFAQPAWRDREGRALGLPPARDPCPPSST